MNAHLFSLLTIGVLVAAGVYLLLERQLTRMLLGLLMIGNAVNLLIVHVSGPPGNPPVQESSSGKDTVADPLAQAMVLTAIVITMGVAAFVLALAYRSYRLTTADVVGDDPEATRVSQLSDEEAIAAERDVDDAVDPHELDAVVDSGEPS
ncbi:Na(+)/H(+) antiporter subunit C [Mycolicibacillus trivialis]|uniref:Cation:proton antiporter n=1 Tax=Mycolicibacillus trivialis TaxID=1798 RepID=A0A1X2EMU2_9MYCO|nr:Na(+)/H(+) antiporter subunit C [Mycolicibacillus trivialis]ORX06974.1 cation:proton antiporter [Mycolicibacillus trivialis]